MNPFTYSHTFYNHVQFFLMLLFLFLFVYLYVCAFACVCVLPCVGKIGKVYVMSFSTYFIYDYMTTDG